MTGADPVYIRAVTRLTQILLRVVKYTVPLGTLGIFLFCE